MFRSPGLANPLFKFLFFLAGLIVGSFIYNFCFYDYSNIISSHDSSLILPDLRVRKEVHLNCSQIVEPTDYVHRAWKPIPHQYLFAACQLGQLSNRISCLRRTLIVSRTNSLCPPRPCSTLLVNLLFSICCVLTRCRAFLSHFVMDFNGVLIVFPTMWPFGNTDQVASILNRTLLIPNEDLLPSRYRKKEYNWNIIFDVAHARHCLGENTLFFVNEFLTPNPKSNSNKPKLRIDRVMCWNPKCAWNFGTSEWKTISLPKKFENFTGKLSANSKIDDVLHHFGNVKERIITFGDLFHSTEYFDYNHLIPHDLKIKECKLVFKPHNAILKAARGFVRHVLGKNYASVHLRRTDFMGDVGKIRNCYSTVEVSKCLHDKLKLLNINLVFVATDTFQSEFELLQDALRGLSSDHKISSIRLPNLKGKIWAQELNAMNLADDPITLSIVEKVVASLSLVFYSDGNSTFSNQIREMRRLLGTQSCHDEHICDGKNKVEGNVDRVIQQLL